MAGEKMTKNKMYFKMISQSLLRRRSRMLVALLAIAVGATVLSGLTTVYYDIPRQMGQEFRSYGANLVLVPADRLNAELTLQDIDAAAKFLPADSTIGVAPFRYENVKINEQPFIAAGTKLAEVKKPSPYWFIKGTWPANPQEALLGQEVAEHINLAVGDTFVLQGSDSNGKPFQEKFTLSGIVQTGGREEAFIFLDLSKLDEIMGGQSRIDSAECSISVGQAELNRITENITAAGLNAAPRQVKRVTSSEVAVLGKLQALVYLVTIIVLLLTMVCVATTMMAVVTERRKEIGLKKALGASDNDIIKEFLGEGLLLGIGGGILGVILGFAFAQVISLNVFTRAITFQPLLIPITLIVSATTTVLACLLPVRKAAKVNPAIVLRGE